MLIICFFFNDTATTEIYTLSLHDALPIFRHRHMPAEQLQHPGLRGIDVFVPLLEHPVPREEQERREKVERSEEHTSELQSRQYLVCRLLLEKKKKKETHVHPYSDISSNDT